MILSIVTVILYQIFYDKTEEIPEIVQTVAKFEVLDTINIGIIKLDTMNPIKSKNEQVQHVSKLVFESLFDITKDFKAKPCLATMCTRLDELTYIIKLRENVRWHDNSILTANEIELAIYEIKMNEESIFYNNVSNIKSVKTLDETTLRIDTYVEDVFFEYKLTFPIVKNENVGTGKYQIKGELLKYNTNYWKKVVPEITNISIKQYEDISEMYVDFKNGNLDIISTKSLEYKAALGSIGFNKKEYYGREYTYLQLNNIDLAVRKAMYYAINKSEIISKVYNNNCFESEFPMSIENWLYKGSFIHKYDIEKAIETLENAGWKYNSNYWKKDKERIELTILIESEDYTQNEVSYILKEQLEKIGLKINIEKVSKNLYKYYLNKKNYDIIIVNKRIDITPDLKEFWKENSFINSIKRIDSERVLIDFYKEIEKEYEESLPFLSLCTSKQTLIYSEKIHGSVSPNWYNIFYDIENWKKIN